MTNANPLRVHLERMLMAQDGVPLDAIQLGQWVDEARAALAAAPQPALADREALVEVIEGELKNTGALLEDAQAIADALLARGLRLPPVVSHEPASRDTQAPLPITDDTQAAPGHTDLMVTPESLNAWLEDNQPPVETMAWAVTTREGKIDPHMLFNEEPNSDEWSLPPEGKVARVAIRVVEGGDDAA